MPRFITDVLSAHAEDYPQKQALIAIGKNHEEESLTYSQLVSLAKHLAVELVSLTATPPPVVLCLNSGVDFVVSFLACMFAGRMSVPATPPKGKLSKQRLAHICATVKPDLVLTSADHAFRIASLPIVETLGIEVRCINIPRDSRPPPPSADIPRRYHRAFIQFTSGSTSLPKAMVITHDNLLSNHETIRSIFGQNNASIVVSWLPPYHDMGLIGCILHPLLLGATTVLLRPSTFAQSPLAWLKIIMRHRATISGAPNFAFDYCVRHISDADTSELDLSSLQVLFNGSERVSAASMRRFEEKFRQGKLGGNVFCPCYGLAEATLMVTGTRIGSPLVVRHSLSPPSATESATSPQPAQNRHVGCGRVKDSSCLIIVDATGHTVGDSEIGEIWVRGESICEGRMLENMQVQSLLDSYTADGQGPFLRTGDEGFIVDAELFVTGRLKDVLVVRGIKFSPEEMELVLSNADLLSSGCRAAAIEDPSMADTDVILLVEVDRSRSSSLEEFERAVMSEIARETGIRPRRIVFLRKGVLPRTTSGKINRPLCAALLQRESVHIRHIARDSRTIDSAVRPFASIEEQFLILTMEELLGKGGIQPSDNPFAYGLSSVETNRLVSAINDRFHAGWTIADLYAFATIESAATELQKSLRDEETQLLDPGTGAVAALPNQRAMWIQSRVDSGGLYNVSVLFGLDRQRSSSDAVAVTEQLSDVINQSISKHRILRSSFHLEEGLVCLKQESPACIALAVDSFSPQALAQHLIEQQKQSFDFGRAPMVRVTVLLLPQLTLYHLVCSQLILDGYSIALLCQEWRDSLNRLQQRRQSPGCDEKATEPQFDWFANWFSQKYVGSEKWEQSRNFWANELRHADLRLRLPVDIDSADPSATFQSESLELDSHVAIAFAKLSGELAVTPSLLLLTHTIAFLRRITSQHAVCLGIHTAGRVHHSTRRMIGPLLNTICFTCEWADDPTYAQAVQRTAARMSTLLKHELFPFAEATRLSAEGTGKFSRLPSVYFNAIDMLNDAINADFLQGFAQPTILGSDVLLTIHVARAGATYALRLDFNSSWIRSATVKFWSGCILKQIQQALSDPQMRLSQFRFPTACSFEENDSCIPQAHDLSRVPLL